MDVIQKIGRFSVNTGILKNKLFLHLNNSFHTNSQYGREYNPYKSRKQTGRERSFK